MLCSSAWASTMITSMHPMSTSAWIASSKAFSPSLASSRLFECLGFWFCDGCAFFVNGGGSVKACDHEIGQTKEIKQPNESEKSLLDNPIFLFSQKKCSCPVDKEGNSETATSEIGVRFMFFQYARVGKCGHDDLTSNFSSDHS